MLFLATFETLTFLISFRSPASTPTDSCGNNLVHFLCPRFRFRIGGRRNYVPPLLQNSPSKGKHREGWWRWCYCCRCGRRLGDASNAAFAVLGGGAGERLQAGAFAILDGGPVRRFGGERRVFCGGAAKSRACKRCGSGFKERTLYNMLSLLFVQ